MIEASNLTKFYGNRRGIEALSFHAEPGDVVGFLGPNGAGKTTTIKLLTGFFPPSSGNARVGGFDVQTQSDSVRSILGYLPENAPTYPQMTIEGFLGFFLDLKRPGMRGKARRAEIARVLEAVQLSDRRRQLIRSLSKGLRQRTGLAQALLGDPAVIILDEPTAGLDPAQVQSVRELIQAEAARGRTILLSTHILREVEAMAKRIVIVANGRRVAFGTVAELTRQQTTSIRIRWRADGFSPDEVERELRHAASNHGDWPTRGVEITAGVFQLRIADNRLAARLTSTIAQQDGWELVELTPEAPSLEDIFLESVGSANDFSTEGTRA
jgi:ABC-2 type transport system ATP-binding protein